MKVLTLLNTIVRRKPIIKQPALVNLRNVPDESLIARLQDFMKDNPVGFPVLPLVSNRTLGNHPASAYEK